eukprot:739672-Pelagomonas_calceolata.AAC.3
MLQRAPCVSCVLNCVNTHCSTLEASLAEDALFQVLSVDINATFLEPMLTQGAVWGSHQGIIRFYRVVPALLYLEYFCSDRSHMKVGSMMQQSLPHQCKVLDAAI